VTERGVRGRRNRPVSTLKFGTVTAQCTFVASCRNRFLLSSSLLSLEGGRQKPTIYFGCKLFCSSKKDISTAGVCQGWLCSVTCENLGKELAVSCFRKLSFNVHGRLKVKCTLVVALRFCTGPTVHRGSRGIALLYYDHCTRRERGVSVRHRPLFTPGKDPVPLVQEAGWAQGP